MEQEEDDILDMPEAPRDKSKEYFNLRMISTIAIAVGLVFRLQHWPYSSTILIFGAAGWTIWNFLDLFAQKKPKLWRYAYFVGRLALVSSIFLLFLTRLEYMKYFLAVAGVAFLVGFATAPKSARRMP
ncbi:hypothetical protein [Sanyastnella coralliicola]|uniref:hypothetical protein n=1 Tax=Sanyastnella coralliicola TaxID=3069118 RepID=UPI0027B9264E|nr:hypothetical protein [Longitalea sp. SCSIO 12813]